MFHFKVLGFCLLLGLLAQPCAAAEPLSPIVSAPNGALIELDAEVLESRLGLSPGRLNGITVTELPDPALGRLVCEGVEVLAYDYLARPSLDWLVYLPYGDETSTRMGLLPDAPNASYAVVSLLTTDRPDADRVSVSVSATAWLQARNGYWEKIRRILPLVCI